MKKIIGLIILLLLLLINVGCDSRPAQKFNLSFEQFNSDENLADGWFKWSDYKVSMDSDSHSGSFSGKITSDKRGYEGRIAYLIPGNYDGDTIRLEGYMKIKDVKNGFAGLIIRMEGKKSWERNGRKIEKDGFTLGFQNMEYQDIQGTKDWQKYTIALPYPEDVERIYVGGILSGSGEAWFDDFVLKIDGKDVQTLKENDRLIYKANLDREFDLGSTIQFSKPSEELVDNLQLLGQIWGFLKYYHPEVGRGNYNWDYELFRFLPEYLNANNIRQRDKLLIKWLDSYGKLKKCDTCKETSSNSILKPDLSWIENDEMDEGLKEKLIEVYQNRHQGEHFYIGKTQNIGNPKFKNEKAYYEFSFPDGGFRLLSLFKYWNMVQYFYPYKHLIDKNWNKVLKDHIPKFTNAKNELEYELAITELIGDIRDSHARIGVGGQKINAERGVYYPPFQVQFIEGKLVVTSYHNPDLKKAAKLEIGDMITHIDGRSIEQVVDSLAKYYPASNNAAKMRDISIDILRSKKENIKIEYISNGQQKQKVLSLYDRSKLKIIDWHANDFNESNKMLRGNIGYINLRSLKQEEIQTIKESFKDTKGIIIDIRGYPNTFVPYLLGSYFVSSAKPFVKISNTNLDNPGEFNFEKQLEIPKPNYTYQGKLVVLVNENSQSQSEFTAMAFRVGNNTTIVGSTTAGADGNVSQINLPGGISTRFSGNGIYYPDGTETQRVGIVPDIEVKPTIKGIKNGKDELLEKAIELINE